MDSRDGLQCGVLDKCSYWSVSVQSFLNPLLSVWVKFDLFWHFTNGLNNTSPPPSHFHRHPLKLHTTSFSSPTYKSLNGLVPQYLSNLLHPHTQSRLPWSVSLPPQPPYFHGQSIHFGCPHPPSFTTCHWDFFCCYSSCYYNFYYYNLVWLASQ